MHEFITCLVSIATIRYLLENLPSEPPVSDMPAAVKVLFGSDLLPRIDAAVFISALVPARLGQLRIVRRIADEVKPVAHPARWPGAGAPATTLRRDASAPRTRTDRRTPASAAGQEEGGANSLIGAWLIST